MNTGELPDGTFSVNVPNLTDAIDAGLVLAWDDWHDYTPQLLKIYDMYPIMEKASSYEGKHWYYPNRFPEAAVASRRLRAPLFMNTTWLERLNLEVPETMDELYEVLVQFKTGDPNGNGQADEIPLHLYNAFFGYGALDMFGAWGIMGIKNAGNTTIRDGKLDFNPVNPNYRLALEYFHKLYAEGLVHPESLTMDTKTQQAILSDPATLVGLCMEWDDSLLQVVHPGQYEAIAMPAGPNGDRYFTYNDAPQCRISMVIFEGCEQPEILARWMDNCATGQNALTFYAGIKGVGWDCDDATMTWWTRDAELMASGTTLDQHRITEAFQNNEPGTVDASGYTYVDKEDSTYYKKNQWSAQFDEYLFKEYYPATEFLKKTTEEAKEVSLLETELNAYITSFIADAVMNGIDDAKWETHIKQCELLQYQRIVDFYQQEYDSMVK